MNKNVPLIILPTVRISLHHCLKDTTEVKEYSSLHIVHAAAAAAAKSLQSCPILCDPIDCSPPGSSVHGIFQARVLEWGAIAFSGI